MKCHHNSLQTPTASNSIKHLLLLLLLESLLLLHLLLLGGRSIILQRVGHITVLLVILGTIEWEAAPGM